MRLLQLATGPGEMIDLHPHVTVVTGLDPAGRQLLADAVMGLTTGRAVRTAGLLEAHGVLFDLEPEALALLDIDAADVRPVVTAADLPTLHHTPPTAERISAEAALAAIEERWHAAGAREAVARSAVVAATAAVERARLAVEQVDDPTAAGPSREELTLQHTEASDQVRRLSEELAGIDAELVEAAAERAEVEAATAGVLAARQAAAVHCSDVAARLEAARMACDPDAGAAAQAAAAELEATEAAVEAEREAEERAGSSSDVEPPADRLARVEAEIEAVERKLAVFGPADVARVADELEPVRALDAVAPLPEALDLASELAGLEDDLRSKEAREAAPTSDRAAARARLDAAHEKLVEAEQAVRHPELDRVLVDRLEIVHANLLDAIERSDGRFAGARAQRRVEACRDEENALLDELGLPSYSEFMMGSSLLHVDPVKEFALEEARAELAVAEDAWRALNEETDAELARAQQMERRRGLLDEARGYLGGSMSPGSVIDELRALRVDVELSTEVMVDLRRALDEAGVVVGDEDLDRDDLLMVAEAWITEVGEAASRERSLRAELASLVEERAEAEAMLGSAAAVNGSAPGRSPEEHRIERLELARERHRAAEERYRGHLEAEQEATALVDELATAAGGERTAVETAAAAEAALAAVARRESDVIAARERVSAELAMAEHTVSETSELLQGADDTPREDPQEVRAALGRAEVACALAVSAAAEVGQEVAYLTVERNRVKRELAALSDRASPFEVTHLAEEVEWYLLARLAAQRSVSLGGSLPLLLDDALAGLPQEDMEHVLGRLERMSETVQVIVISDHPATAAWVALAGEDRAAVVRPQADSMV